MSRNVEQWIRVYAFELGNLGYMTASKINY